MEKNGNEKKVELFVFPDFSRIATEKLVKILVDRIRLGIVVINQEHKVIEANQCFSQMLGYSMDEVLELHTWDWEADLDRPQIEAAFRDLSIIDTVIETRHQRKDGSIYDVEVNIAGTQIQDVNGHFNVVMCICRDISEEKQMKEKLRIEELKYRTFVEHSADTIFTVDDSLKILYISPNCKMTLGYDRNDLLGERLFDYFEEEDSRKLKKVIKDRFMDVYSKKNEFLFRNPEGETQWYSINFTKMEEENKPEYLIGTLRNITDKKITEEKLRVLSTFDQLTGIYNRFYFEKTIRKLWKSNCIPIAVVIADVDGLKLVNDTLGHDAGDRLIQSCVRAIKKELQEQDIFARLGGDEFGIILPETSYHQAQEIMKRVEKNIEVYNKGDREYFLSVSYGISIAKDMEKSFQEIQKEADFLMYENKRKRKLEKKESR